MQETIRVDEPHTSELVPPAEPEQKASTAVALVEEPIIEGEVTAVIEPEQQPKQQPPRYSLLIFGTILVCLVFLAVSLVLPLVTPSATVTIIPSQKQLSMTASIPVQGRLLVPLTLSQAQTVQATGKRHQAAAQAQGSITFYNGQFSSQTIAAGTTFTGQNGVQVVTDQTALIPAGNPPIYGQVSIPAHAVQSGSQGNIPAYDISTACCLTSVLAKNTSAFTSGAEARDYTVVTRGDIDAVVATLKATLTKSEQAALQAQVNPGEGLVTLPCDPAVTTNHQPGEEATQITVTISVNCTGVAYDSASLQEKSTQLLTQAATTQVGVGYSLVGSIQISILHTTITDQARGIATIAVKLDGTYIYQISPGEQQHITKLIAGKNKQQAIHTLESLPGIQRVKVTMPGGENATLPGEPSRIHITLLYREI